MNHATISSTARVPTMHGARYLQQLCKHWAHNLAVSFDETHGRVVFPRDARGASWAGDGIVTFAAESETLVCAVTASEPGQLEGLKGAVARHLDRFAFREAPLAFDWIDSA
ncbi:DUF2218 domain-containing protein [Novosphingobium sp. KCTC 2891]|uniref:DUF2218 domain-containing protein n=1 Tax=Novosphingobium sp. KCTC 2891 TaxID=2989730 RepID=UPI002222C5D6|nr:DUF2218 domain-containing protein [Novosphingobium sp. KCTC 2891]MCW1381525.1 DUF2218 domain-containing protein [Novosphingobium sp. KCTC 2891]